MSEESKPELLPAKEEELEEVANMPDEEAETEETAPEQAPAAEQPEAEEAEEEKEAAPRRKKKEEEEIVEEKTFVIPLQKALVRPPKKRAPRAMQLLKLFVTKHMKVEMKASEEEEEEEMPQLIISQEVNEKIWSRGIEKPPRKIQVRAAKDKDGNVTVYLAEKA